ncbi:unnamed protein product, partial [Coregonus sp. 'balchen']
MAEQAGIAAPAGGQWVTLSSSLSWGSRVHREDKEGYRDDIKRVSRGDQEGEVSASSGEETHMDVLETLEALGTLRDQLTTLLDQHQTTGHGKRPTAHEQWVKSFLHHGNRHSCLHWPGAALTLLVVLVNAAALLLLFTLSFMLIGRQQRLRKTEMVHRLNSIINQLNDYLSGWADLGDGVRWSPSLYPDLYTPSSPSWSLHWTYRDSKLVNLPVSLLVEGDVIALRPGKEAFASLRGIKPGDLFPPLSPPPSPRGDQKRGPQSPQQHRLFRVVRTPILDSVRNSLDLALSRPITALDNERFTVQSIMARFACPIVLVAFLVVNTVRYFCDAPSLTPGRFNFIQLQLMGVLPILPLLFPVMWVLVNAYGEASVLAESSRASPTGLLAKFSEDTLSSYTEVVSSQEMLRCVWRHLVGMLKGESQTLCYTSSLLHTLGSVTVLCGQTLYIILPNPKTVLFFSGRVEPPHNDSQEDLRDDLSVNSFCRMETDDDRDETQEGEALLCMPMMEGMGNGHEPSETSHDTGRSEDTVQPRWQARETRTKHPSGSNVSFSHNTEGGDQGPEQDMVGCCDNEAEDYVCDYHLEMLSLSQDQQNPVSIQFDEQGWQCHLPSLKPLGLNILLNLCNASVTQQLCRFSDHLSNLALQESHGALPCGEKAKESVPRRLHNFTKRQPPISHLISLFIRDSSSNNVQMLSHGSADLILEACTDRACLSGYCSAFAYKPMQVSLSNQLNGKCVELAPGPNLFSGVELPSTTPIKYGSRRNSWSSDGKGGESRGIEGGERREYALVTACIRFVYFSMEDELRSKVFAEKMGLETGWNCHISLTPNRDSPCDGAPNSPGQDSLHDDLHQDSRDEAEGPLLPEEETADVPSFLEDCNRAKLPRGIHQVRPHLKNIDNVPLLVPLFTDCTPESESEHITENREVTCCLGSSANFRNSCLFLQSDLSIALDPLYPSRCSWETFGYATGAGLNGEMEGLSPLSLSGQLNTLASSCQLTLVLIQFLACLAQLPPPMNITDILWLSCFSCPLLSVSFLGKPPEGSVMNVATGKNQDAIPRKTQNYFLGCFLLKFGLTVCAYLLGFGFTLHEVCLRANNLTLAENTTISCTDILRVSSAHDAPHWFRELSNGLLLTQKPLWKKNPFSNTWWCLTVPIVLLGQLVQATVDYQLWQDRSGHLTFDLKDIPMLAWLLVSLSSLVVVLLNEAVKLHEIRVRVRYQKRQKLQFETKLGMNSPF